MKMTKPRTTHPAAHQKAQSAKKPAVPSLRLATDTGARERSSSSPRDRKPASLPPIPAANGQKSAKPAFGARISRRASDRLRSGHLWVYASDVEHLDAGDGDAPALLPVADNRGLLLGTALYSPSSQIALRIIAREAIAETEWLKLLETRLRAAIARRLPLLSDETDSCRLCFSEADELPGLIVDKYGDLVIVQRLVKGLLAEGVRAVCARVLREDLEAASILERPDPKMRELEGLAAPDVGPVWAADAQEPKMSTLFRLHGIVFHFDANAGQKTGAFLDQRANYEAAREWARRLGATERVLDVCCYQGGFALHLAEVCRSVTGIDASRSSLEVAERNVKENRARLSAAVDWVEADAFQILRDWSDAGEKFDTIVLDPPAFAKSKRAVEGALRGYKELNLRALKMLRPGGLLVTCSCSHHISGADFTATVAAAAGDAGRHVRLLERRGAAPDHPVVMTIPETEYLKVLVLEVE